MEKVDLANLQIGDPWPFASCRGLVGKRMPEPKWFAIIVPPQKERQVSHQMKNAGVQVEWPKKEVVRVRNGKAHKVEMPFISGIIYAKFYDYPQWDVMKQRRVISGVFCDGIWPVSIPDEIIHEICNLPFEDQKQEKARLGALMPDDGETVELRGGLFDGVRVDVVKTHLGRVWFNAVIHGKSVSGECDVTEIKRLA